MDIKRKQINEKGTKLYERNVYTEASYLSNDFLNIEKQPEEDYDNENDVLNKPLNKSLDKYLDFENGEQMNKKVEKYHEVARQTGRDKALTVYSNTYGNHSASKRKKSFNAAADKYTKAGNKLKDLNRKLDDNTISKGSREYIEARVEILQLRLDGMLKAAEGKSYSSNDEKLRKSAAKVKIYEAMLNVYSENSGAYAKKIAKLTADLQKERNTYNRLLPADKVERENEKKKRKAAKNRSRDDKMDELQAIVNKIMKGEDLSEDEMPSVRFAIGNESKEIVVTSKMYNEVRKKVDLKHTIEPNADDMDKYLKFNENRDFMIVQAVLAACKKKLFELRTKGAGLALQYYVQETAVCTCINNYLRTGESYGHYASMVKTVSKNKPGWGDSLKEGLKKSTLDYDIVVRRGVGIEAIGYMLGLNAPDNMSQDELQKAVENNINNVCTDKGVVSTSVIEGKGYVKDLELVILCKKGTHALDISHGNGTKSNKEEELCIAPDTKFIIVDSVPGEDGAPWKVYLRTVVGNGDKGELA